MKKMLWVACLATLISHLATAQKLYVRAGIGQNLALSKSLTQDVVSTATGGSISAKFVGANLAKGLTPAGAVGFMFTPNIGIELGAAYSLGSENPYTTTVNVSTTAAVNVKTITQSKLLTVTPAIKLRANILGERAALYSRFGVVLPVSGYTGNDITRVDPTPAGPRTTVVFAKTKGQATMGLGGALGAEVKLFGGVFLWGEVNAQALRIWANTTTIETYTVNGQDALAALKVYDKETVYVESLSNTSNNQAYNTGYSADRAKEELVREANFDAAGLAIGIGIRF